MAITIDGKSIDDLTAGELVLDELASRLPSPTAATSVQGVAGGLFGARALDLHRGFVHALDGPSTIAPTIMGRPLVELAILLRWIRGDPQLRFEMWTAHTEEMDAKDARGMTARAAAGRETPPRLLPGLVAMVDAIVKGDTDEGLALRRAYDLAFRSISPATHSDASSFKESLREQADGSIAFIQASPVPIELLRRVAAGCLAYAIESAAKLCEKAEIADAALAIRLRLAEPPSA